jgi:hypothetical protein
MAIFSIITTSIATSPTTHSMNQSTLELAEPLSIIIANVFA